MNQTFKTSSYFDTALTRYAEITPWNQAIIAVNDSILLEWGTEIHPMSTMRHMIEDLKKFDLLATLLAGQIRFSKITTIEKENEQYDIYTYSIQKNNNVFRSIFLIPLGKVPIQKEFQLLNDLILNYYMNLPVPNESFVKDINLEFLEMIMKELDSHFTSKEEVGVISHFYIQDLRNYYKNMSQQYAEEIHSQIKQGILRHLKKGDLLFRVNQRSYITYSHNCNIDTVKKRFSDIFFQLNTLIIRYKLSFHKNDYQIYKKREFWNEILSGN